MISILATLALQGESGAAKWNTNYKEAVALAQKLGKPIVIDAGREA